MDTMLSIAILSSVTAMVHLLCLNGSECPSNQPFCTPVGCVFRCPDSVFISGINCVESCGENFIYNRTCVQECPSTFEFIREKVSTDLSYRHKFCEKMCPLSTLIHNRQCVDACPEETLHLLNNTCVRVCPATQTFRRKIFKDNSLVAIECLVNCKGDYPFSYGNFCISMCKSPLFQFEKKCVDKCPNTTSVIFKDGVTWYCANECPRNGRSLNGTCVARCPPNYVVYNQRCVTECPQAAPFTYVVQQSWWDDETECVKQCPDNMYVRNNSCVDNCPLVLNRTCVAACPDSARLKCNSEKEKLCRGGATGIQIRCVKKCPNQTHEVAGMCIFACPDNLKYFNHTCLGTCPVEYKYTEITQQHSSWPEETRSKRECVAKCPSSFYRENETCGEKCPDDKYTIEDDKLCLENCPSSHPLVSRSSHSCVKQCDKNQWPSDGSCFDFNPCETYISPGPQCVCKSGSVWFINTCTEKAVLANLILLFIIVIVMLLAIGLKCFTNMFEYIKPSCTEKICSRRQNENEDLLIEVGGYETDDGGVGNEDVPT